MLTGMDVVLCIAFLATGKASVDAHPLARGNASVPVATDPHVDAILSAWEKATTNVSEVTCEFRRFKYDHTLAVEFRSVGSLSVDRFGTVDYDVRPAVNPRGVRRRKLRTDKQTYDVRPDSAQRIQFTREFNTIDQAADIPPARVPIADLESPFDHGWLIPLSELRPSGTAVALPPEGADIPPDLMELPLWNAQLPIARPFVLGLSRAEVLAKFEVTIIPTHRSEIGLEFIPRAAPMRAWYSSARLLLNPNDFTPVAILTKEADGQTETVHVLKDVKYIFKTE